MGYIQIMGRYKYKYMDKVEHYQPQIHSHHDQIQTQNL